MEWRWFMDDVWLASQHKKAVKSSSFQYPTPAGFPRSGSNIFKTESVLLGPVDTVNNSHLRITDLPIQPGWPSGGRCFLHRCPYQMNLMFLSPSKILVPWSNMLVLAIFQILSCQARIDVEACWSLLKPIGRWRGGPFFHGKIWQMIRRFF